MANNIKSTLGPQTDANVNRTRYTFATTCSCKEILIAIPLQFFPQNVYRNQIYTMKKKRKKKKEKMLRNIQCLKANMLSVFLDSYICLVQDYQRKTHIMLDKQVYLMQIYLINTGYVDIKHDVSLPLLLKKVSSLSDTRCCHNHHTVVIKE